MLHQLPHMGICFIICALSLIAPSLGGDYVAPPPPPGGYVPPPPPPGGYVPPPPPPGGYVPATKCCDNSVLINGRCVCKPNYTGHSTHPCVLPCWDKCGKNTYCDVKVFKCYCKKGYTGNPYSSCYLPCYGKCVVNAHCNEESNQCECNDGLVGNGAVKCYKPSVIVLAKTSYTESETVGQIQVEVLRQGSSFDSVAVAYKTQDLTATFGADYSGNHGVIVFGNGQTTKYITFNIINDKIYEQAEKFKVKLVYVSSNGVLGSPIEATITITNDDKPCGGSCRPYSHCDIPTQTCVCDEGYILDRYHGGCRKPCGGRCCANAYCNKDDNRCYCNKGYYGIPTVNCYKPCKDLCRKNAHCGKYNKCVCDVGFYGNPYEGCYPPCRGLCRINARCDIASQKCVCKDGFFGNPYKICDKPGVVEVESVTETVNENAGVVTIKVKRTGSTFSAVAVTWVSHDITAVQGSDYIGTGNVIFFGITETSKTIVIQIKDDLVYEKVETFSVSLTHTTQGAVLGQDIQTVVTIKDNDAPCGGPCPQYSECDIPSQKCVCIKGYIRTYYGGCSLPCGGKCCANAYCDPRDNRCKCKTGYYGMGTVKCYKPCYDACRSYATCGKDNRCYCNKGYYGNPYKGCYLPCHGLCKENTRCDVYTHRCYCKTGFFGNPLKGCSKPGSFVFTKSAYTVKEDVGIVQISVSRVGSSSQAVTVYWKTKEGSAKPNSDYGTTGGTLYFASGQTSKVIHVYIADDQVYEPTESFTVTLSYASAGGVLGTLVTATITILDNDDPCGGPCPSYSSCDENKRRCVCDDGYVWDSHYRACVKPCGGRCCVNAYCDTRDNTCKCKPGYKGLGTVGCYKPCRDACKRNAYCGPDDRCCCNKGYYGDPYVGCTPPCNNLCKRNARCDIPSQTCECLKGFYGDPLVGCGKPSAFVFAKPVYTVNEDAGAITVTVNRIGSTYGAVTVTWVTTDISAEYANDFLNNGGTLFFGHGVSSVSIIISIVVDKVYEVDEKFKIMLTKVTPNGVLGVLTTTIVNIINDDKACGGPCGINAFCDMPSQQCVCNKGYIRWQGVCGRPCGGKCCAYSYCSPRDNKCHCNPGYIGNPTEKCYKPCNNACKKYAFCGKDNKCHCKTGYYGNPYQDCHLPCHDQCHKSKNTKCDIPSQTCVCLPGFFGNPLKGCQKPSVFVIAQSTYAVKESAQVVTITVNRIGASSESVKVTWTATDSTAVKGHDYLNTGGILFFGSGDTSKTISIHIIDDSVFEPNEQFRVELTHVTVGGIIGLQRKAIVIIENDDKRCGGKCVFNAYCNHADDKCYCNKGLVGDATVKCELPCGGHCGAYAHSHCNYKTNKCECDEKYTGDPYHGGCVCTGGHGDTGGYTGGSHGGGYVEQPSGY